MKFRVFLLFFLFLVGLGFEQAAAQKSLNYQLPNHWMFGVTTGLTAPYHDVRRSEYGALSDLTFNLGGHLTYWFNPAFGLRGQLLYGRVNSAISNVDYLGRLGLPNPITGSTTYFEGMINGVLNFSGLGLSGHELPRKERKLNIFTSAGLGIVNYNARTQDAVTGSFLYARNAGRGYGNAPMVTVGLGASYKVAPRFHIDLQFDLHNALTDAFDGMVVQAGGFGSNEPNFGRGLDKFGTANVSFVFGIGKNRQGTSVYWHISNGQQMQRQSSNRMGELEQKLKELQQQNKLKDSLLQEQSVRLAAIDRQMRALEVTWKKDEDSDGVPDLLDREFTKWDLKGIKPSACGWSEEEIQVLKAKAAINEKIQVDAFGIALDSDGDGVPDHLDKCPTVPGNKNCDGCRN